MFQNEKKKSVFISARMENTQDLNFETQK